MATTLSTAEPNSVEVDAGLIYFRCPNGGEIHAADDGGLELPKKLRMGYQPLDEYGRFGNSAYYVEHPFEPLFQAGGAREMPISQIIANGFHLNPPLVPTCGLHVGMDRHQHVRHRPECWRRARPVVFPQLEGVEVPGEQVCDYCGRDDLPSPAAKKQHTEVMHSDKKDQEAIVAGIVTGMKGVLGGQQAAPGALETLAQLLRNPDALAVLKTLVSQDSAAVVSQDAAAPKAPRAPRSPTPRKRNRRKAAVAKATPSASPEASE